MSGLAASPTALRQVALAGGDDLDETLAFWRDVLGLEMHARFDPPGIAFILIGGVRLFFADGRRRARSISTKPRASGLCRRRRPAPACPSDVAAGARCISTRTASSARPAKRNGWPSSKDPAGNTDRAGRAPSRRLSRSNRSRVMKIVTWNINGIRARLGNFTHWLRESAPDIVCLQEIKSRRRAVPARRGRSARLQCRDARPERLQRRRASCRSCRSTR